jgi:DNA-binding NarL/FixJ family response regulator
VIRVFIVAASPLARAGLENLLAARHVEVAGSVANLDALAGQLPDAAVEAILIDSSGEPFEPLLDSVIASGLPSDFQVVVLAEAASPAASAEALHAGVRAVLPNDISPDQLDAALEAAASGLVVLHPAHFQAAVPAASLAPRPLEELLEPLTPRESEVLQMLAAGLGNKEIAAKLGISEHTVKFHVGSILGKLGAATRTEAVSLGIRRGLVLL